MNVIGKGIIIVGPTASGKSTLALRLAQELGGMIINSDSMQVYRELSILSARPTREDMGEVPHLLYGEMSGAENCSVAKWSGLAGREVKKAWADGRLPILVGGSGLYVKVMMNGISPIPELPLRVRDEAYTMMRQLGPHEFLSVLRQKDPGFTALDPQRMIRAWEVLQGTGKPLSYWQTLPPHREVEAAWTTIMINLPREKLYENCDMRFVKMIEQGAIEEAKALYALDFEPHLTVMHAIGVRELGDVFTGRMAMPEAIRKAQQATRNYAKRQLTWFSHQLNPVLTLSTPFEMSADFISTVKDVLAAVHPKDLPDQLDF